MIVMLLACFYAEKDGFAMIVMLLACFYAEKDGFAMIVMLSFEPPTVIVAPKRLLSTKKISLFLSVVS